MPFHKNRIPTIVVPILAVLLSTPLVYPWGRVGHRVASRIAEERLTPAALKAVHELLGPGVRLEDVSTWADEQRDVNGTGSWHYVYIPISMQQYDPKFCPSGGCVVSKIQDFKRVLQDRKAGKAERQQALKFLIHIIEDLHQPLLVGDAGNKGGALLQVRFYGMGSNLHLAWDSQIIEHYSSDERVWLWELTGLAYPKAAAAWSKGIPEDWAAESLQAAKTAYCLPGAKTVMRSGARVGDDYLRMAIPIIQKQLAKAGVRLAWILNEMLSVGGKH
jgi:nuclease S1